MKLDAVTYPDATVSRVIGENFVPAKIMVMENPEAAVKYGARWTPTLLFLDGDGNEHHRCTGYLPPREFLAQLGIARAKTAFDAGNFEEAAKHYGHLAEGYADTTAAPEALYWLGVSRYKARGDVSPLKQAWETLSEKHPDSEWTKKASFLFG